MIDLTDVTYHGLIVLGSTGVRWNNQAGGCYYLCQCSEEGIYIPIRHGFAEDPDCMHDKWFVPDEVDPIPGLNDFESVSGSAVQFLKELWFHTWLTYDEARARTIEHGEAWIPVVITSAGRVGPELIGRQAILVCQNSD